ncbi:MAG: hypothetical protein AB1641_23135 [Thermodesulfobacteriota bacterium]
MYYLAASGFCVAALIGSVIYETRRLKKEEKAIRRALEKFRQEL